jgi:hypothetical protein
VYDCTDSYILTYRRAVNSLNSVRIQYFAVVVGVPVQDLSNFKMAPIPYLSDLTCSTHSPHDILNVWNNKIDHTLPVGCVKRDICVLGGCNFGFLSVFD